MAQFYPRRSRHRRLPSLQAGRGGGAGSRSLRPRDIGADLMRAAFHPDNGPLTDTSLPKSERESLAHLFAGAIGSYKNPSSHRTVAITDIRDAQEQVLLASHLLGIVDAR